MARWWLGVSRQGHPSFKKKDVCRFFESSYEYEGRDEDGDLCFSQEFEYASLRLTVVFEREGINRRIWLLHQLYSSVELTDYKAADFKKETEAELAMLKQYLDWLINGDEVANESDGEILRCLAVLGLDQDASWTDVRVAFRDLSKKYHPDAIASLEIPDHLRSLSEAKFREARAAYEVLKDHLEQGG